MYAIIMAPEFGEYQIFGADEDPTVELYEINIYDDSMVLMERVGGSHERTLTRTHNLGAKTSQNQTAPSTPGTIASTPQTEQLYNTIRARLLDEFPGAEEHKKKVYSGFRYPGGQYFCTLVPQKSKIWLTYSGMNAVSELRSDDFVRNVDGLGIGKLRSEIKKEADFEKALVILKKLHRYSKHATRPTPSVRQAGGKRVFPDELLERAQLSQHNQPINTFLFTVRLFIAEGDRTVLTYGGVNAENYTCIFNQTIVPDPFPKVVQIVKKKIEQAESLGLTEDIIVSVDTTGAGASLLADLLDSGIPGCVGFRRTDGKMDAAYSNLRTELEAGHVFVQDSKYPYRDELYAQLRGIVQSGNGTMSENSGSDHAASLAIAVWGAKQNRGAGNRAKRDIPVTYTPEVLGSGYG